MRLHGNAQLSPKGRLLLRGRSRSSSASGSHTDRSRSSSRGCCDGSSPIFFEEGELPPGLNDLLLGTLGQTPFYIDAEQHRRWCAPSLVLDVRDGAAEGFSLEGLEGVHVVTREA